MPMIQQQLWAGICILSAASQYQSHFFLQCTIAISASLPNYTVINKVAGTVAQRVEDWTCNQQVVGSNTA